MDRLNLFQTELNKLVKREDFSKLMVEKGFSKLPFVLAGIDNDSHVMISEGQDCFVANGYNPDDANVPLRHSKTQMRYFIAWCCKVVVSPQGKVTLRKVMDDKEALVEANVARLFDEIIEENNFVPGDKIALRSLQENQHLIWEVWSSTPENQRLSLRCYIDSGRIEIAYVQGPDSDAVELLPSTEYIDSQYSRYKVKHAPSGIILERDEWNRKIGGIDAFIS